MEQPTLAIFANFFIDNNERFQRLKDSFYSFKDIEPNEWVINIRGNLKNQVGRFLKEELGDKVKIFYLHGRGGWMVDSRIISNQITSNYVLFWIEDHILMAKPTILNSCIIEMKKFNVDQLHYSWFYPNFIPGYDLIKPHNVGNYITVKKLDFDTCHKLRYHSKLVNGFYTVGAQSVMCEKFFKKILFSSKPYLKRSPRKTPFDFEKKYEDKIIPVIWNALPNQELFAAIDDDHSTPNYSLISRGLYPNRLSREDMKIKDFSNFIKIKKKFKKSIPRMLRKPTISILYFIARVYYTLNFFINNR